MATTCEGRVVSLLPDVTPPPPTALWECVRTLSEVQWIMFWAIIIPVSVQYSTSKTHTQSVTYTDILFKLYIYYLHQCWCGNIYTIIHNVRNIVSTVCTAAVQRTGLRPILSPAVNICNTLQHSPHCKLAFLQVTERERSLAHLKCDIYYFKRKSLELFKSINVHWTLLKQ